MGWDSNSERRSSRSPSSWRTPPPQRPTSLLRPEPRPGWKPCWLTQDRTHALQIGQELLTYNAKDVLYPVLETTVTYVSSAYQCTLYKANLFLLIQRGDILDFYDSSGDLAASGQITDIQGAVVTHTANYSPTVGDTVKTNQAAYVLKASRGQFGTRAGAHDAGAEVQEVRVLEGNLATLFLQLALSVDGDGTNHATYDVLPPGWGAGLDEDAIDVDTLETVVAPRVGHRRYVLKEPQNLLDWIGVLAEASFCRMYWDRDGILTASPVEDLYPLGESDHSLSSRQILAPPTASISHEHIRNAWTWKADYTPDGNPRSSVVIDVAESQDLYGVREKSSLEDKGVRSSISQVDAYVYAQAALMLRAYPLLEVGVDLLFDEDTEYLPGQLVQLTILGLPNLAGGEGLSNAMFEILEVVPRDNEGLVSLRLLQREQLQGLAHVAPVGYVQSVSGDDVTIRPASQSRYAPATPRFIPPQHLGDGTEDIHWFLVGDAVQFWDVSTFGGSVSKSTGTVVFVDYGSRILTFDPSVVPGWLTAGDLVRFDTYSNVFYSITSGDRIGIFACFASGDPPLLGGTDPPNIWGL